MFVTRPPIQQEGVVAKSKQAIAKQELGFQKESPRCSNCKHFDYWEERHAYGSVKREQKCKLGGFACKPMNYCNGHAPIISE